MQNLDNAIRSRLEENKDSLSETIFQNPFEKYNLNKDGIAGQNIAEAKYICFQNTIFLATS